MKNVAIEPSKKVKLTRFPLSLFGIYFLMFLLISGIHMGFIVLVTKTTPTMTIRIIVPVAYWVFVSVCLTIFTRQKMKKVYEEPMQKLAKATSMVANGDFSIYISPVNPPDKQDYLDVMIQDFNTMVEALGSIETLKTDFISNVSHEIKTPLAVIQNATTLLKNNNLTHEEQTEYIKTIETAARRLTSLITNILKLNKLEKQTLKPTMEKYDICAQLAECAIQFENVWEKKNIEFDVFMEDEAFVTADESLMELVWNNLISNALKFTEEGGKVSISQKTEGEKIIVSVSDTGCGMDESTVNKIFDKFYQGDTSHSTEGNGLGLAILLRVIELMNAEVTVNSKVGKGSTFTVTLNNTNE